MTRPPKNPSASGIQTRDLPLLRRTPWPLWQRGGQVGGTPTNTNISLIWWLARNSAEEWEVIMQQNENRNCLYFLHKLWHLLRDPKQNTAVNSKETLKLEGMGNAKDIISVNLGLGRAVQEHSPWKHFCFTHLNSDIIGFSLFHTLDTNCSYSSQGTTFLLLCFTNRFVHYSQVLVCLSLRRNTVAGSQPISRIPLHVITVRRIKGLADCSVLSLPLRKLFWL